MPAELRQTGIETLGEMAWGAHFCHFYEAKQDLLDIIVPYFKAGLEANEFCLWIITASLSPAEATGALQKSIPDLEKHLANRSMEIVAHDQWYLDGGNFDSVRVINRWKEKLDQALARGYAGMRAQGNEAWLTETDWKNFMAYEERLNETLANQRMIVLCSYPLGVRRGGEIFDVIHTHQVALSKRNGNWEMLETPEIRKRKAELEALKVDLERRVDQRASQLAAANQPLQETQRKFEEAQRIAHVGHWERDLETDVITWSDEIYRIFGLRPRARPWSFSEFLSLVATGDRARVVHSIEEAVRNLRNYALDYKILRADGCERFVHSEGEVIRDTFGRALCAFGILQDITEHKESENTLRQSESQLRLVIDTIPAMAWSLLPDGTLDFINHRWLEYTGLTLQEALEQAKGTIHPEDLSRVMEKWSRDMAAGNSYEDEMRLRRADGEYRWFLIRTAPLFDNQRNILKWYGTSTDIEDRKRAEEALRETQAILAHVARTSIVGELTASIAHEVNQPLGAIVTNAEAALHWLADEPPNLAEGREALGRIIRDGDRASQVVARIRALLTNGKPMKTTFGLDEVIREVIALTKAEAERRQVSFRTRVGPNLLPVTADRIQVQQVLMNLVMNSLDALSEVADRLRILTIQADTDPPRSVRVAVHDTGVGIDPQRMKDLFTPFCTTKPHGLGLGLSISRSIIEAHGGRLGVTRNDQHGVTFHFTLPVNDNNAT